MNVFDLVRINGVEEVEKLYNRLCEYQIPDDMTLSIINGVWVRSPEGFTVGELRRVLKSISIVSGLGGQTEAHRALYNMRNRDSFYINLPGANTPIQTAMLTQALRDVNRCYPVIKVETKRPISEWVLKQVNNALKMVNDTPLLLKPIMIFALSWVAIYLFIFELPFVWLRARKQTQIAIIEDQEIPDCFKSYKQVKK
ncbi:hypothetical protein [Acinetobacter seifertii]|uniref:hypothetical protein n=1 Tax=Acinetobacter seifertii TaxID=1530123 RepID=UPI00190702EC|nr:hypothetical protein [Acinetobacter seifertii]MBJ9425201.1 hypothetical protein [Acinetobacter seifertii]